MRKKIGQIIRNGRLKLGLSQLELAKRLGVNQSHVSKWENDESIPTGDDLMDIAVILDIVGELFPGYIKNIISNTESEDIRQALIEMRKKMDQIESKLGMKNGSVIYQNGNHLDSKPTQIRSDNLRGASMVREDS